MENDLQKQIAQLVLQTSQIVARDRIGNLIGFLERIGRDRAEILLEVPRTSGAGVRSAAMISISREISREGFTGSSACGGWAR
jgi:hypothetical protein